MSFSTVRSRWTRCSEKLRVSRRIHPGMYVALDGGTNRPGGSPLCGSVGYVNPFHQFLKPRIASQLVVERIGIEEQRKNIVLVAGL